jgi:hypothetical protein
MCPIRDITIVFNGDGIMKLTGLLIDGTYITNKEYDISIFEKDLKSFRSLLCKNFGIDSKE